MREELQERLEKNRILFDKAKEEAEDVGEVVQGDSQE